MFVKNLEKMYLPFTENSAAQLKTIIFYFCKKKRCLSALGKFIYLIKLPPASTTAHHLLHLSHQGPRIVMGGFVNMYLTNALYKIVQRIPVGGAAGGQISSSLTFFRYLLGRCRPSNFSRYKTAFILQIV